MKNYSMWETMAYGLLGRQFPGYRKFADGVYKWVGLGTTIWLGYKAGMAICKYLDEKLQEKPEQQETKSIPTGGMPVPLYAHECKNGNCTLLGNYNTKHNYLQSSLDVYFCMDMTPGNVITRYGDEGHQWGGRDIAQLIEELSEIPGNERLIRQLRLVDIKR